MNAFNPHHPYLHLRRHLFAVVTVAAVVLSLLITVGAGHYVLQMITTPAHDWTIDLLVSLAIAGVGVAVGLWLTVWSAISVLCILAATLGHRVHGFERLIADRGPALLRRLVVASIGVGLTVTAAPAMAADGDSGPVPSVSWALGWQDTAAHAEPPAANRGAHPVAAPHSADGLETVTVQPGDSLWSIAAAHLFDQADPADDASSVSDAAVAVAWPAWFELNEEQIGSDPNLIKPGQQLQIPTSDA